MSCCNLFMEIVCQFLALTSGTGNRKPVLGSQSFHSGSKLVPKNITLSMKLLKQRKTNANDMNKRKVKFSVNPWTMTAPVSNKKRKMITRRNSWPPDSPRKLNTRKKYQQRFKSRDFPEPFWTDTYEWLIMKYSPESLRSVPLVKLSEFDDQITVRSIQPKSTTFHYSFNAKSSVSANKIKLGAKSLVESSKYPDLIAFYFIRKANKTSSNDPKKYLRKLKERCWYDCTVRELNPTNFNSALPADSVSQPFVNNENYAMEPQSEIEIFTSDDVNVNVGEYIISDKYWIGDEMAFDNEIVPFEDNYQLSNIPARSSLRPLQSSNLEGYGDVLIHNVSSDIHNISFVKNKPPLKQIVWNKENIIKSNKSGFPDAKFPDFSEKPKTFFASPMCRKEQKISGPYKLPGNKANPFNKNPSHLNEPNKGFHKLPKDIDDKSHDIPHSAPQDMPDPNAEKTSESSKSDTSKPSHSQQERTTAAQPTSESPSSGETSTSSPGQSNKPYLRQLFEKDIQSNFAKSLKLHKDNSTKKDESDVTQDVEQSMEQKENDKVLKECDKAVQASSDISDISPKSSSLSQSTIPADVVGYSFIKSLKERAELEETAKETTFPASVIGHAFLKALVEQQNKIQENVGAEKTVPASVVGLSFLKNLIEETPKELKEAGTEQQKTPGEKVIPSFVLGQAFLKTLMDDTQTVPQSHTTKPVPATVIGQTFLKSLVEQSDVKEDTQSSASSTIPANVIGQSFLKNLLEQSSDNSGSQASEKTEAASTQPIPATVLGQSFLKTLLQENSQSEIKKEAAIPAPVIGQAFLKTLLENQSQATEPSRTVEKPIPSFVVGQSFLKSLIESSSSDIQGSKISSSESQPFTNLESSIPATVIGQTFLKSLIEEQTLNETSKDQSVSALPSEGKEPKQIRADSPLPIPAPVIGQAFLKSLIQVEQPKSELVSAIGKVSPNIPASVVGQAFLKMLIDQENISKSDSSSVGPSVHEEQTIPASAVSQSFLKSLIEHEKANNQASTSKPIPSSVIGQAFLKTLAEHEKTNNEESAAVKAIPASVVGQAFLKTLVEHEHSSSPEPAINKPIPASVVGQAFLKTLVEHEKSSSEESVSSKPIPASVVGQAFLKTLVEHENSSSQDATADKPIPASVVGQAFLKTLVEHGPPSCQESTSEPIPAAIIGHAFLKTLVEREKSGIQEPTSTPIPSSVVGQVFLKTLIDDKQSKVEGNVEKFIPSAVVGQSFLKTLIEQQNMSTTESVDPSIKPHEEKKVEAKQDQERLIPSAVLSQSFLKSLLEQGQSSPLSQPIPDFPSTSQSLPETSAEHSGAIPAAVIGSAFLKVLTEQAGKGLEVEDSLHSDPSKQMKKAENPLPANVVGQAFLKTLLSMTTDSQSSACVEDQGSIESLLMSKQTDQEAKPDDDVVNKTLNSSLNGNQQISSSTSCDQLLDSGNSISALEDPDSIIPPPPEFCGSDTSVSPATNIAGSSSSAEVTPPGIIGELLTYTKMMHSVIESMKDSSSGQSDSQKK